MTTASPSAPAPSSRVTFATSSIEPGGDARAWGHLETKRARVGVVYQRSPQPHLTFFPPVRVPDGCADVFLDACLAHAQTGRSEWNRISVDPADGEVSLRLNLASDEGTEIERALERAAAFFDEEHEALAKTCLGDKEEDDEDDEDDDEGILPTMKGVLDRWFGQDE